MRITRVRAQPEAAAAARIRVNRVRETVWLAVASLLVGFGLRQVYHSRDAVLAEAERRLAAHETLLLARLTPAAEISRYLSGYSNSGQRQLVATKIADLLRHEQPENVGALGRARVTRMEAQRRGAFDVYRERFVRAEADSIRLFTSDEFAARIKPAFAVRTPGDFRGLFLRWTVLFFAGFWAAHLVWLLIGFRGDQYILPVALVLTGVGLILMVSLRDPIRDLPVFSDFASGVLGGCVVLIAVTCVSHFLQRRRQGLLARPEGVAQLLDRVDEALRFIVKRGDLAFVLSLALSAALLVFGSGPGASGAKVRLFFFQPVEMIRFLLVLFFASYFARRWEFLRELREKRVSVPFNVPRLDHALPVMLAVALAIGFFFLQKDLGPALVLAGLFLVLYGVARARGGLVLGAAAVLVIVGWLAYKIGYPPVAVTRIGMWLQPWSNGLAHGDQLVHSLWAMAGGAARGAGIGRGTPEVIPAGFTDLILPVLGEETGFVGLALIVVAYGFLFRRSLRIAARASTTYEFFLALGLTVALALEGALIAGGVTGLMPLSGVVTPFLSYGGSAMTLNFLALGILLALSAKTTREQPAPQFRGPLTVLSAALALFACALVAKAGWVQLAKADDIVARGTLVAQEDGSYAMAYNPRLLAIARQIERGSVYDRTGLPLATSRRDEIEKRRADYAAAGVDIANACSSDDRRCYPFGPVTFHLVGDVRTRVRWTASNASFEERVSRAALQGFDDREALDTVEVPRTGKKVRVYQYDYTELVPLLRAQMDPNDPAVRKLLDTPRDVRLTVDARFQARLTQTFQEYLRGHGWKRGSLVVIRPVSGDLLAAVSLPLPHTAPAEFGAPEEPQPIDYARFGQYPPGSAFKLVTAIAALRVNPALVSKTYQCVRLPDGRVGNTVRGRVIRDDVMDTQAHGTPDMRQALIHSCNAYFAQLGTNDVGAQALLAAASLFNIETAAPNTAKHLNDALPQASYGQGEVLVTPYRMARVAAALANHGALAPVRFRLAPPDPVDEKPVTVLPPEAARELEVAMRGVVTSGTGREAASAPGGIAGKTGTAELRHDPAHAWFVGFTPYDAPPERRIAFAILVENARYGGRAAAPFANRIAEAARALKGPEEEASVEVEETPELAPARTPGAARSPKRDPKRH